MSVETATRTVRKRKEPGQRMMNETELMTGIIRAAESLGYLVFHPTISQFSKPGYPDLTICGYGRYWQWECKGPKGIVSAKQQEWIDQLQESGVDARVVWPGDYDDVIKELQRGYEDGRRWESPSFAAKETPR